MRSSLGRRTCIFYSSCSSLERRRQKGEKGGPAYTYVRTRLSRLIIQTRHKDASVASAWRGFTSEFRFLRTPRPAGRRSVDVRKTAVSARRPVTDSRAPEREKCPPALWATSHSSLGDGLLLQTSHVPWSAWSYVPGTSVVSNAKTTVPIEMPFRRERSHTCVDCGPKDGWGAH